MSRVTRFRAQADALLNFAMSAVPSFRDFTDGLYWTWSVSGEKVHCFYVGSNTSLCGVKRAEGSGPVTDVYATKLMRSVPSFACKRCLTYSQKSQLTHVVRRLLR